MRFFSFVCCILFVGCSQKQPPPSQKKLETADTLIQKTLLKTPASSQDLNWSSVIALMESLHDTPSNQRKITLTNIKEEAVKLNTQPWPKDWDINPIRARFNVFITHASIAADQRLADADLEKQSLAIKKMKASWNNFADQINDDSMLAPFNPTLAQPISKIK